MDVKRSPRARRNAMQSNAQQAPVTNPVDEGRIQKEFVSSKASLAAMAYAAPQIVYSKRG